MSAPMIGKSLTFSKLKYIRNFLYHTRWKGSGKYSKSRILSNSSLESLYRTEAENIGKGTMPTENKSLTFREMIECRYMQADRSILLQLKKTDEIHSVLNSVQQTYNTTIEKAFLYSDYNGKDLMVLELADQSSLLVNASSHIVNLQDLNKAQEHDGSIEQSRVFKGEIEEHRTKVFNPNVLNHCDSVSEQVMCLHNEMKMSEAMIRLHFFVGMLVSHTITQSIKGAKPMFFGSAASGFSLEGKSDLDIVVLMDNIIHPNHLLSRLVLDLKHTSDLFRDVAYIKHARVPIIKFEQHHTLMPCDLSCNILHGILMAEVLYWLNVNEPLFAPLLMTVKMWGKAHRLTSQGIGSHLSNHMLTMLVLAFLQRMKILPSLKSLYANRASKVPHHIDTLSAWHSMGIKNMTRNVGAFLVNEPIGDLLHKFFQYYSEFPFQNHVIDVYFGKVFKSPHKYYMCINDPHEQGHNVCKNVKALHLEKFQYLCKLSAASLETYGKKNLRNRPWGLEYVLTKKFRMVGKISFLDSNIDFCYSEGGQLDKIAVEVVEDETPKYNMFEEFDSGKRNKMDNFETQTVSRIENKTHPAEMNITLIPQPQKVRKKSKKRQKKNIQQKTESEAQKEISDTEIQNDLGVQSQMNTLETQPDHGKQNDLDESPETKNVKKKSKKKSKKKKKTKAEKHTVDSDIEKVNDLTIQSEVNTQEKQPDSEKHNEINVIEKQIDSEK